MATGFVSRSVGRGQAFALVDESLAHHRFLSSTHVRVGQVRYIDDPRPCVVKLADGGPTCLLSPLYIKLALAATFFDRAESDLGLLLLRYYPAFAIASKPDDGRGSCDDCETAGSASVRPTRTTSSCSILVKNQRCGGYCGGTPASI
jgi:hypothetical protein